MSSWPQSQRDPNRAGEDEAVLAYMEKFALALTEIGLQRTAARIFAALTVTESGMMTAAELADTLSLSPAAVSGGVRYLEHIGMVAKERKPGQRRDHYRIYDDLWFASFLKRDRMLRMWHDATAEGIDVVGPDTAAGKRLADMADFLAFLAEEVPRLFDRWHEERPRRAKT